MISVDSAFKLLDSCKGFSRLVLTEINIIARIETSSRLEDWKRARLFNFYEQVISTFENRVDFILDIIKGDIKRPDVLDQIIRGILEIYMRLLFIRKSSEIEKFRRIIWQDIMVFCKFSSSPEFLKRIRQISPILRIDYGILKHLGEDISKLDISIIRHEILESDKNLKLTPIMRSLQDKMGFPSFRKILINYYDEHEEPIIPNIGLYQFYSRLSEQIHGNLYYEIQDLSAEGGKYRILASVIMLQMKFLALVAKISRNEKDYDELLLSFKKIGPDFSFLWELSRKS